MTSKSDLDPTANVTAKAEPDALLQGVQGAPELAEKDLDKVAGGKAKTADKAFNAMDGYIRG